VSADPASRLTRKQSELLQWLRTHLPRAQQPISLDAACAALGLASRGSLHKHVQALVAAGLLEPLAGRQRGLALTAAGAQGRAAAGEGRRREVSLPLLGRVAAGRPIEAIEGSERIEVPEAWADRDGWYALQVRGDSMIDEGICDGDTVIVEHRAQAQRGELVIALVDGSEATLKRFELRGRDVVLHPANSALRPLVLPAERVTIRGVVKGLIRRY
jgi:repressor LexA